MGVPLVAALALAPPALMAGGPWVQDRGGGYAQLSFTHISYRQLINTCGPHNPSGLKRRVSDRTLQGYAEYGITGRLTIIGVFPLKILSTGSALLPAPDDLHPDDTLNPGRLTAAGNVSVGGRYLLHEGKMIVSAEVRAGLNTASFLEEAGLRSGYDASAVSLLLSAGRSAGRWYFYSSAGYRAMDSNYAGSLLSESEVGRKVERKKGNTWLVFSLTAELPVTTPGFDNGTSVHTGLYVDGTGFISPGLKINHGIGQHLYLNVSAYGAFYARLGGKAPALTAGVAWDW